MIRINLLPVRRRRAEETVRNEVLSFFLLIFLSVGVMGYFHFAHSKQIKAITLEKKRIDSEINRYRGRQRQLKELEKKKKILLQKLAIIERLRTNRDLLVRVLDELATRIPLEKMWLRRVTQRGDNLIIEGVARGNETIAQFMESLAASPYIDPNRVVLQQSRQEVIEGYKLKGFHLVCHIVTPKEKAPAKKGKKPKTSS